jgi:hypothetical protein
MALENDVGQVDLDRFISLTVINWPDGELITFSFEDEKSSL